MVYYSIKCQALATPANNTHRMRLWKEPPCKDWWIWATRIQCRHIHCFDERFTFNRRKINLKKFELKRIERAPAMFCAHSVAFAPFIWKIFVICPHSWKWTEKKSSHISSFRGHLIGLFLVVQKCKKLQEANRNVLQPV